MPRIDPDYAAKAKEAAGNWQHFDSFAWHEQPDDAENWCHCPISNRDADLLQQSNSDAIKNKMDKFTDGDDPDCRIEYHDHWAVGWVEVITLRVYNRAGEITEAFRRFCDLNAALEDYPVLDESDYSRRVYEATCENIAEVGGRFRSDKAPEDWAGEVFSWLWDNDQSQVENTDDRGAYPAEESVKVALYDLGWLDAEHMTDDQHKETYPEEWDGDEHIGPRS